MYYTDLTISFQVLHSVNVHEHTKHKLCWHSYNHTHRVDILCVDNITNILHIMEHCNAPISRFIANKYILQLSKLK